MRSGLREMIGVWPDGDRWIVSHDWIDEDGGAERTTTIDVYESREEATTEGLREGRSRGLPVAYTSVSGQQGEITEA